MSKQSNILDPIHEVLAPSVWEAPASPTPSLKLKHKMWTEQMIYGRFNDHGYDAQNWASLYVTGSITTYQYSDDSDFDVSLFVNADVFPDWSRAEMIGIAVEQLDGNILPGTTYPLQVFIVPEGIRPRDIYKRGLRSGYDLLGDRWINPPDPSMAQDPEVAYNAAYTYALEQADKMERLLKYEPHKAETFWHQIHKRRRADQKAGKGDYAPSNIVYKMLANRGILDQISDATGEYIARTKTSRPVTEGYWENAIEADPYVYHETKASALTNIAEHGLIPWDAPDNQSGTNYQGLNEHLKPRPGHVYFTLVPQNHPKHEGRSPTLRVPKSALDPNQVNPDEDTYKAYIGGAGFPWDANFPTEMLDDQGRLLNEYRRPAGHSGTLPAYGLIADAVNLGEDPAFTEELIDISSGRRKQPIAYNGSIPPEQIEVFWNDIPENGGDAWFPILSFNGDFNRRPIELDNKAHLGRKD